MSARDRPPWQPTRGGPCQLLFWSPENVSLARRSKAQAAALSLARTPLSFQQLVRLLGAVILRYGARRQTLVAQQGVASSCRPVQAGHVPTSRQRRVLPQWLTLGPWLPRVDPVYRLQSRECP